MNRTWVAIISGMVLGVALIAVVQRGCESGASATDDAIASALPQAPTSRISRPAAASPEPQVDLRSTFGDSLTTQPRSRVRTADGSRGSDQRLTRQPQPPIGSIIADAMEVRNRPTTRQLDRRPTRPIDRGSAGRTVARARAVDASTVVETERQRAEELIRSRILQLREAAEERGLRLGRELSDGDGGRGSADGRGGERGEAELPFGANQRHALTTGSGGGGFGAPPIDDNDGSDDGDADPPDDGDDDDVDSTPIGDDDGDASDPDEGDGGEDPQLPDDGDSDDADDEPSGPAVTAVWESVEIDAECPAFNTARTNDLYLGFRDPWSLQVVSSSSPLALRIEDGSFRQDINGGNAPPSDQTLELFPCVAFDSYLAIGDAEDLIMPQAPDPLNWGSELDAVWGTPSSNPFGFVGEQDPERFGDDRYYIRIGRFTATGNPSFLGGSLVVNAFNFDSFNVETEIVSVPFCPDCWTVDSTGEPTGPTLASFSLSASSILSGDAFTATVTLSEPAPEGGTEVELVSSNGSVMIPDAVLVPEGETEAQIQILAPLVGAPTTVTFSATLGGDTIFAQITIQPQPTEEILRSVTVSPEIVRGGLPATGTIELGNPAPAGGMTVFLASDDPSVAQVPASIVVPTGEMSASFEIETFTVPSPEYMLIWAFAQGQVRVATLLVAPPGDLNGDGVVDGADIAALLAAWGSDNPNADLNADGEVNGADLAILLANFTTEPVGDPPFTGDAIARWIPALIDESECDELDELRSNDLFIGFELPPDVPGGPVLASIGTTQIVIENGQFFQHPFGSNAPPGQGAVNLAPCVKFDSFLTVGGAAPTFLPGGAPDLQNWGSTLTAEWFTTGFDSIIVEQNPTKFGDDRFYVWIGRFTADIGSSVGGAITVNYTSGGASQPTVAVEIPNCPVCWLSFDLNEDGVVDSDDVAMVLSLMGTDDPRADLDGDGEVTTNDLRIILDELGRETP